MSIVKYNPLATASSLDKWVNDFFNRNLGDFVGVDNALETPSVNIIETNAAYRLEIAAPGMKKEDFTINLDKNLLTISAEKEQKSEEAEAGKFVRREFNFSSFKRTFNLPETVNSEAIGASYDKGVLFITLPKKEEEVKLSRVIEIK